MNTLNRGALQPWIAKKKKRREAKLTHYQTPCNLIRADPELPSICDNIRHDNHIGVIGLWAHAHGKEHLLVSKALPIFWAPHYFCACSDLSLLCEAYDFSTHSEVSGVPLESSGFRFSSPR
jgi:hypothetical protein